MDDITLYEEEATRSVAAEALAELRRATSIHQKGFTSAHEGYAVILEELDELWDEVKLNGNKRDITNLRKEAIQVAAMAMRFVLDVCNEGTGRR
jgi:hypothetical protein